MHITIICQQCDKACGSYDPGSISGRPENCYPPEYVEEPPASAEVDGETIDFCSDRCRNEYLLRHMSDEAYADKMVPAGCQCAETNNGGDCAWCQAYYTDPDDRVQLHPQGGTK